MRKPAPCAVFTRVPTRRAQAFPRAAGSRVAGQKLVQCVAIPSKGTASATFSSWLIQASAQSPFNLGSPLVSLCLAIIDRPQLLQEDGAGTVLGMTFWSAAFHESHSQYELTAALDVIRYFQSMGHLTFWVHDYWTRPHRCRRIVVTAMWSCFSKKIQITSSKDRKNQ